jgi:hypothetical protein
VIGKSASSGPGSGRTTVRHGYTNATRIDGGRVVKRYLGKDAVERMRTEVDAIRRTAGRVPVPAVVRVEESECVVTFHRLPGRHGQELIDEGHGDRVLEAAGRTLRSLHAGSQAPTWTHGDYGPQNLLFDRATMEVTGVLDWEFARRGDPIDDLAWAEWIVRMHHPGSLRPASGACSKGGATSRHGIVARRQCSPPATGSAVGPSTWATARPWPSGRGGLPSPPNGTLDEAALDRS